MEQTDRVRVTWNEIDVFASALAEAHPFPQVRKITALAFLRSLPMREREDVMELTLDGDVPWPPAISGTHRLVWAREWCGDQPSATVKAYALAAFEELRPEDRATFLAHVSGRAAA